ncbi:hypothetical protein OROHE_011066 [Orobanche hederae]
MPQGRYTVFCGEESIAMADCVFPEDILLCILTRLPLKPILRFKSVCKPWCRLFSSREFMKMHKGQFSSDPQNQSFLIKRETLSLWNIESDEATSSDLYHPFTGSHYMSIVGCCNGLICMRRRSPLLGPDSIVLWNPAMKLFKFVRVSENEDFFTDPEKVSLGLGYDAEGDDFKVVRIVRLNENGDDMSIWVEVYSVNSDSWMTIKPDFHFRVFSTETVLVVNGNPYWDADVDKTDSSNYRSGMVLVWFDVRKMVFKVTPIYTHNLNNDNVHVLMDWEGSLGALVHSTCNEPVDVWVFDDGDYIWRKKHTFGPIEVKLGWILQYSRNGKIMGVSSDRDLFVYDLQTGWMKVHHPRLQKSSQIYSDLYNESLTYIKGMTSQADEGCWYCLYD